MQIDSNSGSLQVQINDESIGMPIPNTKVLIQDESNKIIEEHETEIYVYGYEAFISGVIDIFIALIIGAIFKNLEDQKQHEWSPQQ